MKNHELMKRDLAVLWHPCTQMKDHETLPIIPIKSGKGVWLEDFDGNRYLDAVSSWWVNAFGHANPIISQAIKQQVDTLEHVILAGFSHEPIIELSEKLVAITPPGLTRVFYADNGSAGIEVALKMSFQYWKNVDKPQKQRFVNLANSYHGETLGALALGDVELYKDIFEPIILKPITAPSPDCFLQDDWEAHSLKQFEAMEALLEKRHDEICAVIIEPLIQCAGGMRMYHPIYITRLREACDRYNVHLIADEIAVGFGRTGTLFASEQADVTPDFMCLSKALTGGFLPMCAVLTTETVYEAFYDDYASLKGFLHSHSYTGNPLACAAALATISIFETEPVIENNRLLAAHMKKATDHLRSHPHVAEVRQTGMVLAIEMIQDKAKQTAYDWKQRRGLRVYQHALTRGALLRPLGNVVYMMPPYIITPDEIDFLAQVATEGIDIATR